MKKTKTKSSKKANSKEKSNKSKKKYKVRNWKEYNESLVNRGRLVFHITEEAIRQWEEDQKKPKNGKRGRPKKFSDTAIETSIALGQLLNLKLRQTEGLLNEILQRIGADSKAPDYTTVCLRSRTLALSIRVRPVCNEPIHLVVDSSGAKVFGEGEWKVRQHGFCKHRRWKKLHIGVDEGSGDILVAEATGNETTDGDMFPALIEQLPEETKVKQVSADGGYDKRKCYDALVTKGVQHIAIPPQVKAKIWRRGNNLAPTHPRDESLRRIRQIGRKRWKEEVGYHRRSLVETCVFRLKTIFTDRISARLPESQNTQLLARCKLLNRMTMLGMPKSCLVA